MRGIDLVRTIVGVVFIVHGYQKVRGMDGWVDYLDDFNIPETASKALAYLELVAGIALVTNKFTNLFAMLMVPFMAAAIFLAHRKNGFDVTKGGYEYALVLLVCSLAIAMDTRKK